MLPAAESGQEPPAAGADVPAQSAPRNTTQLDEVLEVTWERQTLRAEGRVAVYEGNVIARYGPTTLRADRLELALDAKTGVASGNVRVEDPDGTLFAHEFRFDWDAKTGEASEVEIAIDTVTVRAEKIEIAPERWRLLGVWVTPCGGENPPISLRTREVTLTPGRGGRARSPKLQLFGRTIGELPIGTFSLDRRVTGFRLPGISFRRGEGLGVTWASSFLLSERSAIGANFARFGNRSPSYGAEFSLSFLDSERVRGLIVPRTELGERFTESYFDNVQVESVDDEVGYLTAPRRTLGAATLWNQSVSGRIEDIDSISKRAEISAEVGGSNDAWGGTAQLRLHEIRRSAGDPFTQRANLIASGTTRPLTLAPRLEARLRVDGFLTAGTGSGFGWVRATPSLVYSPTPRLRVGVAYAAGEEFGGADFSFDRLLSRRGWHLRADASLGGARLSYLAKYDAGLGGFYDREYAISVPIGCFEPFVVVKSRPSDMKIGVRLRIDGFVSRLQNREVRRAKKAM